MHRAFHRGVRKGRGPHPPELEAFDGDVSALEGHDVAVAPLERSLARVSPPVPYRQPPRRVASNCRRMSPRRERLAAALEVIAHALLELAALEREQQDGTHDVRLQPSVPPTRQPTVRARGHRKPRPSATGGDDGVGERRRRRLRRGLLEREGPRIPPCGVGALGRDGPATPGAGRRLGSVGERQLDRRPRTGTSRSGSSLTSDESSRKRDGDRHDRSAHSASAPQTRTLFTGREQAPSDSSGPAAEALTPLALMVSETCIGGRKGQPLRRAKTIRSDSAT